MPPNKDRVKTFAIVLTIVNAAVFIDNNTNKIP